MNPAKFALEKATFMAFMAVVIAGLGIFGFNNMGRLENPDFTIKTALVVTPYPGASSLEVEEEVTEVIEQAIKSMGQVKEIYSASQPGVSYVYVDMKDRFRAEELDQIWDELRKKIRDAQGQLPPGARPPMVRDDFGDVYGVFFALHGEEYSYAQLKEYAKYLKKELLLCQDVARIEFWGVQQEVIYIEFNRAKMARLGIPMARIYQTLHLQNRVESSGSVDVDSKYMRIQPTGEFTTEQEIADLLIAGRSGNMIRLGEIAHIKREYPDPPRNLMRFNGKPAIGIGISTVAKGNVVVMGESIQKKLVQLSEKQPKGMTLDVVYYQSQVVNEALDVFLTNLTQAVAIVILLLLVFMGWRSGLIIGFILLLTILGTFIGMYLSGIDLQKISLGALILALGMLVDNAIVVAEGILVGITRKEDRKQAAIRVVHENAWPLLGATLVAILAFAAIGFAPGNTGEFCRSLFYVMAISLGFSWVTAVTLTPLLCVKFLKVADNVNPDPYNGLFYRIYENALSLALRFRVVTVLLSLVLLDVSIMGFSRIPKAFFPPTTQNYFYVNYWKSQGTHIDYTNTDLEKISAHIASIDGVKNVTEFVGEGALRFILSYNYERPNPAYGQILVEVNNYRDINSIIKQLDPWLSRNYPDAEPVIKRIMNGPSITYLVETRFRGPDINVLQDLARQAIEIMRNTPNTRDIRTDWRQPVQVIRPHFSQAQARRANVSRSDLANALQMNFDGLPIGLYRERDESIPMVVRLPASERKSVANLENVQVWSAMTHRFIPIGQIVTGVDREWEYPIIRHQNQQRSITVSCNPVKGYADPLRRAMISRIAAIKLPPGYTMSWEGEFSDSQESREPLQKIFPICALFMFIILVGLFNSLRKPLMIFLTLPLSIIGIAAGLLLFSSPFGFMSILGFLGLSGMLIKNAIVLIEQVEIQIDAGTQPYQAILEASISRLRPVTMASGTTILGMIPLVKEPIFSAMAVTIMGGLFAATFLTLIIIPVLYSLGYRITKNKEKVSAS